jgi:hypothetical protein
MKLLSQRCRQAYLLSPLAANPHEERGLCAIIHKNSPLGQEFLRTLPDFMSKLCINDSNA